MRNGGDVREQCLFFLKTRLPELATPFTEHTLTSRLRIVQVNHDRTHLAPFADHPVRVDLSAFLRHLAERVDVPTCRRAAEPPRLTPGGDRRRLGQGGASGRAACGGIPPGPDGRRPDVRPRGGSDPARMKVLNPLPADEVRTYGPVTVRRRRLTGVPDDLGRELVEPETLNLYLRCPHLVRS
jgi:hypothetical protein